MRKPTERAQRSTAESRRQACLIVADRSVESAVLTQHLSHCAAHDIIHNMLYGAGLSHCKTLASHTEAVTLLAIRCDDVRSSVQIHD